MCNASAHPVCSNELSWSNIILLSPAYSSFLGRQTADLTSLSISPLSFYFFFFSPAFSSSDGPYSHLYVPLWLSPLFLHIFFALCPCTFHMYFTTLLAQLPSMSSPFPDQFFCLSSVFSHFTCPFPLLFPYSLRLFFYFF